MQSDVLTDESSREKCKEVDFHSGMEVDTLKMPQKWNIELYNG